MQWSVLVALLLAIALVMSMMLGVLGSKLTRAKMFEGFTMTSLFVIQQGSHPQERHLSVKLLSITASMLTLLIFVYYSNDITAKMTVGSPDIPVRTFHDVLERNYKLVPSLDTMYHLMPPQEIMKGSDSAHKTRYPSRYKLFKKFFEEAFWSKIYPWERTINIYNSNQTKKTNETMKVVQDLQEQLPFWYRRDDYLYDGARDAIIRDPNTLWYCDPRAGRCMSPSARGKIKALEMEDDSYNYEGFVLQWNSEYMPLFNFYLLRQHEHGIINRLSRYYGDPKEVNFEMSEPAPLGMTSVMFPFTILGACTIISMGIGAVEKFIKMFDIHNTRKSKVSFALEKAKCD